MDKQTQSGIEVLIHDPKWSFVRKVFEERRQEIYKDLKATANSSESSFEFQKNIFTKLGQIDGLIKIEQELNEIAKK